MEETKVGIWQRFVQYIKVKVEGFLCHWNDLYSILKSIRKLKAEIAILVILHHSNINRYASVSNFASFEQTVTYWWQQSGLPVYTEVWTSLQITNQCMTNWRPSRSSLWLHTKDSRQQTAPSSSLCLKTQNCPTMVNFYLNFRKTWIGICIYQYKFSNHSHNGLEKDKHDKQSWFLINFTHFMQ